MLDTLKSLLASKKMIAALVSAIVAIFGKKIGLDEDAVNKVVAGIVAYILAQGAADFGKSAAQVKA
jgi:hypothetical protein